MSANVKNPTKRYQKAMMLAKAYQMIEKTRDIFDLCNVNAFQNDEAFTVLLQSLDKGFESMQGDHERA